MCFPVPPAPVPEVEHSGNPPMGPWKAVQTLPILGGPPPAPVPPALQEGPESLLPFMAEQVFAVIAPAPPEEQRPVPGSLLFTALHVCVCGFCWTPPPVAEQANPGGPWPPTAEQPARPPAAACELVNAGCAGACCGAPAAGCCWGVAAQPDLAHVGPQMGSRNGVQMVRSPGSAGALAALTSAANRSESSPPCSSPLFSAMQKPKRIVTDAQRARAQMFCRMVRSAETRLGQASACPRRQKDG